MSIHKIVMTKRINNSDDQLYPKTSADMVEYSNNSTVYDEISNLESGKADASHTHNAATQSAAGFMSAADKTKLDGIESGAEANVQSDWNQSDTTADDYIKNKPTNASASAAGLMSAADFKKINPQGIADNTDLNSITADGWYVCYTSNTAVTLSHCPTTMAFYLEVHKHAGVYQHIVEYSTTGAKHFHRNFYSNVWGNWVEWKLTDTTYSAATTSAAGLMSSIDKSKLDNIETLTVSEIETIFDVSNAVSPLTGNSANYFLRGDKTWQIPNAVANITRSGLTYTATKMDGTSFTFNIPTGTASNTVSAGNHTHSAMSAASSSAAGTAGFVPAPQAGSQNYFLRGDATWAIPAGITATSLYDAPTGTDVSTTLNISSLSGYSYVEIYYSQGIGIGCAKGIINNGITPNAIQLIKYEYNSNDLSLSIKIGSISVNNSTLSLSGGNTFKVFRVVGYK